MRSFHPIVLYTSFATLSLPFHSLASALGPDPLNWAHVNSRGPHGYSAANPLLSYESRADGDAGTYTTDDDFGGQVSWQYMTSKDGINSGGDADKVWYLKDAIDLYLSRVEPERRNGVFWAGGATTEDDFFAIDEFIESPTRLDSNAVKAEDVYPYTDFQDMGLDGSNKDNRWWRAINRMSKALAASAAGDGIAYVYLKPVNCRTIFSPPSQTPLDQDPDHNGQATNGEIWYYAELPMLMRNLNIKQIVSFYKDGRKFKTTVEWDADKDQATHPRNMFDDIAMDASPIILPDAAGRPPLKRSVAAPRESSPIINRAAVGRLPLRRRQGLAPDSPYSNTTATTTVPTNEATTTTSTAYTTPTTIASILSTTTMTPTTPTTPQSTNSVTTASSGDAVEIPVLVTVGGTTMISGGGVTSAIPVTATTSIDPKGTEASSSGIAIQSGIKSLIPEIQQYIDNPSKDTADDATDAIKDILPLAVALLGSIGSTPDSSPKSCSASTNLITSFFNAVSCAVDNLTKAVDDITKGVESNFEDVEGITDTVGLLEGLEDPLDNSNDDDDDDDDDDKTTQTEDPTSTTTSDASTTSTCTAATTVSDCSVLCPTATSGSIDATASCSTTCFSTLTGCSLTAYTTTSYTGDACVLPTGTLADPSGPFETVWWDYGVSCAGNCGAYTEPSTSVEEATPTVWLPGNTAGTGGGATTTTPASTVTPTTTTTPSSVVSQPTVTFVSSVTTVSSVNTPSSINTPSSVITPTSIISSLSTFVTSIRTSLSLSLTPTSTVSAPITPTSTTQAPEITGDPICVNHGGPNVPTPYCECSTTTMGSTFFATASLVSGQCTAYTAFPSAVTVDPICVNRGGPDVATPYCQCETTTAGQTFFATASLVSDHCTAYTSFPGDITLAPTDPATTEPPVAVPYVETEANGDVLSYPSQTVEYAAVAGSIQITMTHGLGTPVTLATPVPTQTDANNKGSAECHSIDDACSRAYAQFDDDTIYSEYTSFYSRIQSGIIVVATFGQAGCTAQFTCDDYGIGMSGADIKDAVEFMKDNNDVSKCGTTYLSNTCHITLNYCTNCHHDT